MKSVELSWPLDISCNGNQCKPRVASVKTRKRIDPWLFWWHLRGEMGTEEGRDGGQGGGSEKIMPSRF